MLRNSFSFFCRTQPVLSHRLLRLIIYVGFFGSRNAFSLTTSSFNEHSRPFSVGGWRPPLANSTAGEVVAVKLTQDAGKAYGQRQEINRRKSAATPGLSRKRSCHNEDGCRNSGTRRAGTGPTACRTCPAHACGVASFLRLLSVTAVFLSSLVFISMTLQPSRQRSTCELQRMPLRSTIPRAASLVRSTRTGNETCYCMPPCLHPEDLLPQCTRFSILNRSPHSPTSIAPHTATSARTPLSSAAPIAGRPASGSRVTTGCGGCSLDWTSVVYLHNIKTNQLTLRPQQQHLGAETVSFVHTGSSSIVSPSLVSSVLLPIPVDTLFTSGRTPVYPQGDNWVSRCIPSTGTLMWMSGRQPTGPEPGYIVAPAATAAPGATLQCVPAGIPARAGCVEAVGPASASAGVLKSERPEISNRTHVQVSACCRMRDASESDIASFAGVRDGGIRFRLRPEEGQALEQQHHAQEARRHHRGVTWWLAVRQRYGHYIDSKTQGTCLLRAQHYVDPGNQLRAGGRDNPDAPVYAQLQRRLPTQ